MHTAESVILDSLLSVWCTCSAGQQHDGQQHILACFVVFIYMCVCHVHVQRWHVTCITNSQNASVCIEPSTAVATNVSRPHYCKCLAFLVATTCFALLCR
jgi:hypothetical protein